MPRLTLLALTGCLATTALAQTTTRMLVPIDGRLPLTAGVLGEVTPSLYSNTLNPLIQLHSQTTKQHS